LVKNLALMTHITTEVEEDSVAHLAFNTGAEDVMSLSGEELHSRDSFTVFLNGAIIGLVRNHRRFITTFRTLRRMGFISGNRFACGFVTNIACCLYD